VRHRWVSTARGALIDFLVPRRSHRKGELVAVDDNLEAIATRAWISLSRTGSGFPSTRAGRSAGGQGRSCRCAARRLSCS
jgi:hypothetical protein